MTTVNAERIAAIKTFLESRWDGFLAQFEEMVRINSFSFNPNGVNALGRCTAKMFEPLGFSAEFIQARDSRLGQHLVLRRSGPTPRIGLVSHLDTVFPAEEELRNSFAWRPEGDRIYGPGTVDIKGGTIVALMTLAALEAVFPECFARVDWRVLLNAGEEILAPDFGELALRELGGSGLAALVFETGVETGPSGTNSWLLVTSRKGRMTFSVEASGRGAHAGSSHAKGANAIHQLARAVPAVEAITDYARQRTCTVSMIRGGEAVNRVPHQARLTGEMRAFEEEVLAEGKAMLLAVESLPAVTSVQDGFASSLTVGVDEEQPPWPENAHTNRLFEIWRAAGQGMGMTIEGQARSALSDANLIWRAVPTIDGLGPAGDNLHCSERSADATKDQEYVVPSSMIPKATLNCLAIVRLIEQTLK